MKFSGMLYLVLDPDMCGGEAGSIECLNQAIAGGTRFVQLRAPKWKKRRLLALAKQLCEIAHAHDIPFVIDDEVDVAIACKADGVHVGHNDLPVSAVRELMGPDAIIGFSAGDMIDADSADIAGADYLGVGPVFNTSTKTDAGPGIGVEKLAELRKQTSLPLVAIGGINADNIHLIAPTGIDCVAVVSAICGQANPQSAAEQLCQRWQDAAR